MNIVDNVRVLIISFVIWVGSWIDKWVDKLSVNGKYVLIGFNLFLVFFKCGEGKVRML